MNMSYFDANTFCNLQIDMRCILSTFIDNLSEVDQMVFRDAYFLHVRRDLQTIIVGAFSRQQHLLAVYNALKVNSTFLEQFLYILFSKLDSAKLCQDPGNAPLVQSSSTPYGQDDGRKKKKTLKRKKTKRMKKATPAQQLKTADPVFDVPPEQPETTNGKDEHLSQDMSDTTSHASTSLGVSLKRHFNQAVEDRDPEAWKTVLSKKSKKHANSLGSNQCRLPLPNKAARTGLGMPVDPRACPPDLPSLGQNPSSGSVQRNGVCIPPPPLTEGEQTKALVSDYKRRLRARNQLPQNVTVAYAKACIEAVLDHAPTQRLVALHTYLGGTTSRVDGIINSRMRTIAKKQFDPARRPVRF